MVSLKSSDSHQSGLWSWSRGRVRRRCYAGLVTSRLLALVLAAGGALLGLPPGTGAQATPPPPLPARLEQYLAESVRPSASERQRMLRGEAITRLLDGDPSKEVGVFGVVWVDAPREGYAEAITDIERFERGRAFPVTRKLGPAPVLEEFAAMQLSADDARSLRGCEVGDCKVKLGQESIEAIRARVDFGAPDAVERARAVFRERVHAYVTRYREHGNAGMVEYRDGSHPVSAATEFAALVERMPSITEGLPGLRRYLLHYPEASVPGAVDFLYWQETRFGLKPTIRVSHMLVVDGPEETVVASKMIYASHYFWTALELRVAMPDPVRGRGYWLVMVNRSRSDGLGGFVGRLLRGRVRGEVRRGVTNVLTSQKQRLEAAAREAAATRR